MQILDRYIGRSVVLGITTVTLVLLVIYTLIVFAGESSSIGQANYNTTQAIVYSLLQMPQIAYFTFPMSALLGTLLGLGMLSSTSELVIVRASGVSTLRVAGAVMRVAAVMILVIMFVGEVISPTLGEYASLKRARELSKQVTLNTSKGLWAKDGNTYINVRRANTDGTISGITLYEFDEARKLRGLIKAPSAYHDGQKWLLQHAIRQSISEKGITTENLGTLSWDTLLDPGMVSVVSIPPESLSVWRLGEYIDYLKENGLDAANYQLRFWAKLFMPFTISAMILLGIPFVFGSQRQSGVGQRIFLGFLGSMIFYVVNELSGQMGIAYGLPPFLSAGLPTLLILGMAGWLWNRLR